MNKNLDITEIKINTNDKKYHFNGEYFIVIQNFRAHGIIHLTITQLNIIFVFCKHYFINSLNYYPN
jgi:hypothetical protein